jgi:hypothetical protein
MKKKMKNKEECGGIMEYVGEFNVYIYRDIKTGEISLIIWRDMVKVV